MSALTRRNVRVAKLLMRRFRAPVFSNLAMHAESRLVQFNSKKQLLVPSAAERFVQLYERSQHVALGLSKLLFCR